MSAIQTTLKRTATRPAITIVTTAVALITVALVALLLGLAGASRGHGTAISHPAPAYYPLIHYRGTGAPPTSTAGTPPATLAPSNPRKSYGAVP